MSNVDLSALRIDASEAAIPRRPIGPRLLVLAVVALAVAVAATFLVPILWPARAVRMAAVQSASHESVPSTSGVAEAVGWIEPDPFPTIVRPLVSGHLKTLEVLEGAIVKANETVIARMASAELLAAVDRTRATVSEHEAQVQTEVQKVLLAEQRLQQNAEALLRTADAETKLAMAETKLATAQARLQQAKAQSDSAAAHVKAQARLQEAGQSFPVAIERARADADAAIAAVAANEAEIIGLQREHGQQVNTVKLCKELAADPVDLRGALAVASTDQAKASVSLAKARVEAQIAERELAWATVLAPIDGVVLRLEAQPGDMVGHGQMGIVALYNPKQLRARIDVPMDTIRSIRVGQDVEITSDAIGKIVVKGVVQHLQHESDLLKNTLQVKIGLFDPPPLLRPETLCRARFLATPSSDSGQEQTSERVWRIPVTAIRDGKTFVFDPKSGTARAVAIEVLGASGDARIVRGNLSPTHRVVLEPVSDGEAIKEATL